MKAGYGTRSRRAISVVEAGAAGCTMASLALGPFSFRSEHTQAWMGLAALLFGIYLGFAWWATSSLTKGGRGGRLGLASSTLAAIFVVALAVIQVRPSVIGTLWFVTSPVQPFPIVAAGLALLAILLLKSAIAAGEISGEERNRLWSALSGVAVPAAMVALGLLQASVYILPIGNASMRFWAIADGIFLGQGYPLTLTEPGPMSAGSPPYVYDLPLFPLLIRASFTLLGHDSAALHMPAMVFSALFPLSLYLLIRAATGSRPVAVAFSALASLFPYLRFWVLNLPDPDPFFLTSLCFAAYLYLRALDAPRHSALWIAAGLAGGVASLARPEGILYVGFLGLGILAHRPHLKQLALYIISAGLFVGPMVVVWFTNYGFVWPQNYNKTLDPSHLLQTYAQLDTQGGLPLFYKGLGLGAEAALVLAALFAVSVLLGTVAMIRGDRRLLAMAVPAIANTVMIPLTNPWISNAFHYADFFRHAAFGIPFMVMACAYGYQMASRAVTRGPGLRAVRLVCWMLLIAVIVREGDILANPTATHRPGSPLASQALTDDTHLTLEAIREHPMVLPAMAFNRDQEGALIAYVPGLQWPEAAFQFFAPLDFSYNTHGKAFGYGSVLAFLLALTFAAMGEGAHRELAFRSAARESRSGRPGSRPVVAQRD